MILRTDGIVLRTYRMSDTSKVVVLYTENLGKVKATARGARRPKSKFGASLEPFTEGTYIIYYKEGRDLQTLSEGDILDPFENVRSDFDRFIYASAITELTDHITIEEAANTELFRKLKESLDCLGALPGSMSETAFWFFQVRAAEALGYRPYLDRCTVCEKGWKKGKARFSPSRGGLVCSGCGGGVEGSFFLQEPTIHYLYKLQSCDSKTIHELDHTKIIPEEVRKALGRFLEYHTENRRPLRSLHFKDKVKASLKNQN